MLGKPSKRTRKRLEENGTRAPATVLEIADSGVAVTNGSEGIVSNTEMLLKTTLRVEPMGEPAFEVTKRIRYPQLSVPAKGMQIHVIFDPEDHDELMLDPTPTFTAPSINVMSGDPSAAMASLGPMLETIRSATQEAGGDREHLAELLREKLGGQTFVTTEFAGGGQDDRLDQLEQLGRLHASGVLTDEEFQAEKRKILGSS
jgi:hypothetical protein